MKIRQSLGTRVWCGIMWSILSLVTGAAVFVLLFNRELTWTSTAHLIITLLIVDIGSILALQQYAPVTLTEEGIRIHCFPRSRFLPWSALVQASILKHPTITGDYRELVFLLPGGKPRKSDNSEFLSSNFGKLLYLPLSSPAVQYVTGHYGPLDFDLSDGQPEQSTVVD